MTALDELERLAKYASSGPWTVDERLEAGCVRGRYGDIIVMETELLSDAAFIAAANPETVLALLSERAELLDTVERMRGALEPFAALAEEFSVCGDGQPISIKAASGKSDLNVGHLRRAADAAK